MIENFFITVTIKPYVMSIFKNFKSKPAEKVYWYRRNGEKIDIDEMDEGHLRNALKMVMRAFAKADQELAKTNRPVFSRPSGELAREDYENYAFYLATGMTMEEYEEENTEILP